LAPNLFWHRAGGFPMSSRQYRMSYIGYLPHKNQKRHSFESKTAMLIMAVSKKDILSFQNQVVWGRVADADEKVISGKLRTA
jgi:hypothetical protein